MDVRFTAGRWVPLFICVECKRDILDVQAAEVAWVRVWREPWPDTRPDWHKTPCETEGHSMPAFVLHAPHCVAKFLRDRRRPEYVPIIGPAPDDPDEEFGRMPLTDYLRLALAPAREGQEDGTDG